MCYNILVCIITNRLKYERYQIMDTYSIILNVIMALGGLGLFLIGMKNMG